MRSVVALNFETARAGGAVELFRSHRTGIAGGGHKRDFVDVENVVAIVLWALEQGPPAGLFNVGTGRATSFRELVEALFAAVGQPARIAYVPMPEPLRGGTSISPRRRWRRCEGRGVRCRSDRLRRQYGDLWRGDRFR